MPKEKFYITFSNDEFEYYVPASFVWTEAGLDDLHVQFDGPGSDNYIPKRNTKGKFVIRITDGGDELYFKGMEIWPQPPAGAKQINPQVLKSFWLKM